MSSLTNSERVKIISAVSKLLAKEGWSIVDLTLRQFKLRTHKSWNGTAESYVLEMLSESTDAKLLELASHFGIERTPRTSSIEPSFWLDDHFRLFVTHLAKHKKQATQLQICLKSLHISAFVAHKDIEPTKKWQDEIELALSTADALIALLTPGFHESKWTDQEIGFALGRGLPILTVRQGEDPYGFLAREQAIPGQNVEPEQLARSIFRVFAKNKQTQKRMAESVVIAFRWSHSFQNAKDNFALLEQLDYWDDELTAIVQAALQQNTQVSEAFGIPLKAKQFLREKNKKH